MSAMLSQRQSSVAKASCSSARVTPSIRRGRVVANAEPPKQPEQAATPAQPAQSFKREFRALGSQVIEQTEAFEEPPAKDMWEGENFESMGKFLENYFLPVLVVLGLICGGIAANSYQDDADVYMVNATSEDASMTLVPASVVKGAPSPSS